CTATPTYYYGTGYDEDLVGFEFW
nr:immunoglobulin heavy chain junction region [Macaca mulatta]